MAKEKTQFCIECRKKTGYVLRRGQCKHYIKGQEYTFDIITALCDECGEEVYLPGLMDINAKLIDEQYRRIKNLVTVDDINTLMDVYNIGKAPLSLALGFGEITITRYLQGQYPSIEYSNIIRKALSDAVFMMDRLEENKAKVGDTAFKKSWDAAMNLKKLVDSVSEKMLITISYIFEKAGEITPLALQKILYYIQGIFMVNYDRPLFREECQAWLHGPVYEEVYDMFKGFKYNPIDDKRFVIFKDRFQMLTDEEKKIIDMVLNTFGMYSGKTLERITHKEAPWTDAYDNDNVCGYTNEPITKDAIRDYFKSISQDFDLKSEDGLRKYIQKQLAC